jgi:glycosyltransferase involved in cell wall biosynthesis
MSARLVRAPDFRLPIHPRQTAVPLSVLTSGFHTIWRALPRDLRRRALYSAIDAVAPRATPEARLRPGPVIVGGQLTTASGLGESARLCLDALRTLGWDAGHLDVSHLFLREDLPGDLPGKAAVAGEGGTLILHVNGPLMPYIATRLGRKLLAGRRIIGLWNWELPVMGPDWNRGLRHVHEIWVPTQFNAGSLPAGVKQPVRVVLYPMEPRAVTGNRGRFGLPQDKFITFSAFDMGSTYGRKNPRAAIAAFRQAFGDDPNCLMVLKVGHAQDANWAMKDLQDAIAGMTNVLLMQETLSRTDMTALVASADVVLSLHRAEGFGLVLAEAMLHGVPVVATGWSGNVDFMTQDDSALIGYKLVPVDDPQGTYTVPGAKWAEADVDEAAAWLKRLRDDADFRLNLGRRAKEAATAKLSLAAYRRAIGDSLGEPPGRPRQ